LKRLLTEGNGIELVLCDMNMPGGSGLDFLKSVRANQKTKNLPFLMITTEGQMRIVTEAVMAGVTGYILKPVNQAALADKMGESWRKHHGKK
jgi:two-component system chemotaxis response regulator CheY